MIRSLRRMLAAAALLALAATAVSVVTAGPAQALIGRPHGHVYNGASPRCLDSGTAQYSQLWACSSAVYQSWRVTAGATIVGQSPAGCLDGGAGTNGSGATVAPCNGSASQRWWISGYDSGTIVNQASGRCLDADLGTIGQQGTKVQVWDCAGGANQQWAFEFFE